MTDGPLYSTLQERPALAALVREFARALPGIARELAEHVSAGHLEQVRRVAHRLKGSAGGYGFPDLAAVARDLERSAEASDRPGCDRLVAAVSMLCRRASAGAGGEESRT